MKTISSKFLLDNKNILAHRKCVFIVGAGISVASGIPDFRSPSGIFASLRQQLKISGKQLFTYNFGVKEGSRQVYLRYISNLKRLCDSAVPNETHRFLATFPRSRVYTQNIDGLEERAGVFFKNRDMKSTSKSSTRKPVRGIYLHGNLSALVCQYCGFRRDFEETDIKAFEAGEEVPCSSCEERRAQCIKNDQRKRPMGVMHPGIIHYQQVHPDSAYIGKSCERDLDCDLLIVIGTSLAVDGVKKLVKTFCRNGTTEGKRILVNLTRPTKEWENYFDYFYEGDCQEFVRVVGGIKDKGETDKGEADKGETDKGETDKGETDKGETASEAVETLSSEPVCDTSPETPSSEIICEAAHIGSTHTCSTLSHGTPVDLVQEDCHTSFCVDLQEEIANIVSETVNEMREDNVEEGG